ncbi:MAG: branched-chain amino acid ABC transporter permease [Eubacteriales bacterium]|jgi:branched-chain amino acid transport system permease protein
MVYDNKTRIKSTVKAILFVGFVYGVIKILMLPQVNIINPFYQTIMLKIFIEITLALGLNLITGITGQFSLGHAGFMSLGAYTAAFIMLRSSASLAMVVAATLAGGIVAGLVGLLIGVPTLRLKGDYLAIATLGLGEIIRISLQTTSKGFLGGAAGLSSIPIFASFEGVFFVAVVCYFSISNLMKSSYGRALISVREDEIASEAMGVNVTSMKMLAFIMGTFFAGIAGAMYAGYVGFIQPKDFGFMKSIEILMIVVLGGLGNIRGTVIAAIVLNIIGVILQDFSEIRMILYALLLIIIMVLKSGETPWIQKLRATLNIRSFKFNVNGKNKAGV